MWIFKGFDIPQRLLFFPLHATYKNKKTNSICTQKEFYAKLQIQWIDSPKPNILLGICLIIPN